MFALVKVAIPRLIAACSIQAFTRSLLSNCWRFRRRLRANHAPQRSSSRVPDNAVRRPLCEILPCRCRGIAQRQIRLASDDLNCRPARRDLPSLPCGSRSLTRNCEARSQLRLSSSFGSSRFAGTAMCRIRFLILVFTGLTWSNCQAAGSFQTKPAFPTVVTIGMAPSRPTIAPSNLSERNLVGGCGRGRIRGPQTRGCRGPANIRRRRTRLPRCASGRARADAGEAAGRGGRQIRQRQGLPVPARCRLRHCRDRLVLLPARKEGFLPGAANMPLPRYVGERLAREAILFDIRSAPTRQRAICSPTKCCHQPKSIWRSRAASRVRSDREL